jgi:transcription elongation factor GreB
VNQPPSNRQQVSFSAWVQLEDEAGSEHNYRIVGPDEIAMQANYISLDSPLAKALMGRNMDDQVEVETPSGRKRYWIVDIRYD